jgi:hypothetical protein
MATHRASYAVAVDNAVTPISGQNSATWRGITRSRMKITLGSCSYRRSAARVGDSEAPILRAISQSHLNIDDLENRTAPPRAEAYQQPLHQQRPSSKPSLISTAITLDAAVINEVDAVLRRIGKPMLLSDDLAQIRARWPEIASCFQGQKAYETARGTLLKGDRGQFWSFTAPPLSRLPCSASTF